MIGIENFELQIEKKLERYQQKYDISNADVAWILLRIGTSYYFKDICSRRLNVNELTNDGQHSMERKAMALNV